jgi:hypothetical protein
MKVFFCRCGNLIHFENVSCVACGLKLAFDPGLLDMVDVEPAGDVLHVVGKPRAGDFRMCKNALEYAACNWLVKTEDDTPYCVSCRFNHLVPPLADDGARGRWIKIEAAKRRLFYTLIDLGLPLRTKAEDQERGLAFQLLAQTNPDQKVLTGHADGVITLNIAEADDPYREKVREDMGETYRTLLGHLRHEVGHYYWDVFFKRDEKGRADFRERFGDETQDYAESLKKHYRNGPPSDWPIRFVSAYASSHPWEDWAESWAHYLHLRDTTETARAYGLSLSPRGPRGKPHPEIAAKPGDLRSFDSLAATFPPLTVAINALNRSMGVRDAYPFIWSEGAVAKMRFVHEKTQEKGDWR